MRLAPSRAKQGRPQRRVSMTSHSRRHPFSSLGEISETRYWVYLLLLPSLLLLFLVVAYPTIYGFFISVREMRLTRPGLNGWVGMKHYLAMMSDRVFWISLKNTAIWVVAAVVIEMTLGFVAAVALNRNLPGTKIFGVLILLPYFLPNVVAGHMWALLLDPRLGVINDILVRLGFLSAYKAWFADPNTALAATILVEAWHGFPFFALLFLAGIKSHTRGSVQGRSRRWRWRLYQVQTDHRAHAENGNHCCGDPAGHKPRQLAGSLAGADRWWPW